MRTSDGCQRRTRRSFKTVGDCPDFAQSSEQTGTVPFSETVLKLLLTIPWLMSAGIGVLKPVATPRDYADGETVFHEF